MSYLRQQPELLHRFREGERDALAEVYQAYLPRLSQLLRRGFVLRSDGTKIPGLTSADDLADVVQEAFTRAFKREARLAYDGLRDYWPYLATTARNIVVSRHRRAGAELLSFDPRTALTERYVAEFEPGQEEAPWLDARSLEIARTYVSGLDEPLRGVHATRYVEALSQRDAAARLGMSRPKVRKLEDKLRRGLLDLLRKAGLRAEHPTRTAAESVNEQQRWTTKPETT
jgi:RNA polymerase sigma-70 factor, ECF subfamily